MHDQVNRAASSNVGLIVEPSASCNHDVVPFGLRAECRSLALHVESVMRENVSERRVSNLISELGKVHGLIGNPIERRSSLNVALTSSGEGQSEDGSFVFLAGGGGAARGGSSGVKPSLA